MTQYALRLPEDLYKRAAQMAEAEGVSLNQFFLYAVADMVAELETRHWFDKRGQGISAKQAREKLAALLERVPDVPALSGDELSIPQPASRLTGKRKQEPKPALRARSPRQGQGAKQR